MSLREIYTQLEDKWYAFLDSLEDKGIPIYKLIDPIENAGIPSFPLFIGLIVLIILGIVYSSMGAPSVGGVKITVYATDQVSGLALEGASIVAEYEGETLGMAKTDPNGKAILSLPAGKQILIKLEKEGCESTSKLVVPEEPETITLETQCIGAIQVTTCLGISPELETVALQDPNGYPAQKCTVMIRNKDDPTDVVYTDWFVDGDGDLHLSEPETCPNENYEVVIDCANAKYEADWDQFVQDIKLGTLTMEAKVQATPKPLVEEDNTVTIPVCVYSQEETPLTGILVKAVDELGNDLDPGVSGVILQGQTDSLGCASLVFPKGQEFYIYVEDPNGAYFSKLVGSGNYPFTASATLAFSGIKITLDRGYPTYVYVKEEATQTPVVGAMVTVKYDGKVVVPDTPTDANGLVSFVLLKGVKYTLEVRHPKYGVQTGEVEGGGNTTIWMSAVDLSKVGNLDIKVINAHGMKEPLAGVRVRLVKGNVTYAEKITNDAGLVKFTQIEEGDYTILAIPPGSVSYQTFTGIHVTAGNTTQVTLGVVPTQVQLTVIPLICIHPDKCVPKENVHVELWNSWLEEKVGEQETGTTRKAKFTVDYGTPYYIVASWVDPNTGKKYGPVTYRPSKPAYQDTEINLEVREMTDEAKVYVGIEGYSPGDDLPVGKQLKGYVTVTLPEFAPGTKFKEIDVEIFTGDPGELSDIRRTPIAIGEISLNDLATQDPLIADLFKSNEYYYGKEPRRDDTGLSKYIKIVIGSYKNAKSYTAIIPLYIREGASGKAKINYRATWITPDGRKIQSNEGLWETVEYGIASSGQTGDISLETGPFYSYNAWLTLTKTGKAYKDVTVTNGSYVYLHFKARARDDVDDWIVELKSIPEKLRPVAFEGEIVRHGTGNVTYITQTELNNWEITNQEDLYALKKDDVLHGIVTLQAIAPGKASVVLFRDVEHPLGVKISEIPALQKETPVAGVIGKISASWRDMQEPTLTGQINIAKDVLPTDNKYFWLDIDLTNEDDNPKTVVVFVKALDDSIKFTSVEMDRTVIPGTGTYVQNVTVDLNGKETKSIRINGEGYSSSLNQMGVFVYEFGTPMPSTPWTIINYGPVNFKLVYRCLMDGKPLGFPTEACDEVDVKVIKNVAGQETSLTNLVTVKVNGKIATLTDDYFKATFPSGIGRNLKITAESDYFGELTEEPDVAYVDLNPEYPNAIDFTHPLPLLNEERVRYINITNYYPVAVQFDVGDVSAPGWEIKIEPKVYAMNNRTMVVVKNVTEMNDIEVLPGQTLAIAIKAKPIDIVCREFQNPILEIDSKDALAEPLGYGIKLQCNKRGGVVGPVGFALKPQHVVREAKEPGSITEFSCSYVKEFNVSYLCDAEQLAIAIAKAADKLLSDPSVYSATYVYAFGNDELTQAAFEQAIRRSGARFNKISNVFETKRQAEMSSGHDIVFPGKAYCGYVTVNLTKFNMDQDVYVDISVNDTNAIWCDFNTQTYLVGLMNYDRDIRPLFGKYYSFDQNGDNAEIFEAIDIAKSAGNNVTASALFGYGVEGIDPETIVSEITGGQAQSFVKWKVCSLDQSIDCPGFAVNYLKSNPDLGIIGYMRINEYNDVFLGLVYRKEKVPAEMLDRYKAAMITRLMAWAIDGQDLTGALPNEYNNNAYWLYLPEKDDLSQVIDVVGPDEPSVLVMWTDDLGIIHTDFAGSLNVTVRATTDNSAKYCYVANVKPDGTFVGPGGSGEPVQVDNIVPGGSEQKTFEVPDWTLIPGLGVKRVAVYCVDEAGVTSPVGIGEIKLDTSGIDLVGRLPETVLMFKPFETDKLVFHVMSRYTDVTKCWLEWPKDTNYPQTDGELGYCNEDKNKDGNVGDGCCNVDISWNPGDGVTLIYNYAEVTCNSPTIPEGEYNKYLPVNVVCENAAGVKKTLGQVYFYEYAPGAPQIFLPQTPFAMGWWKEDSTTNVALDQPLINGESFYCQKFDSQCSVPTQS